MNVWIEPDYETQTVKVWTNENPYGVKADIPEDLLAALENVEKLYAKIKADIMAYTEHP